MTITAADSLHQLGDVLARPREERTRLLQTLLLHLAEQGAEVTRSGPDVVVRLPDGNTLFVEVKFAAAAEWFPVRAGQPLTLDDLAAAINNGDLAKELNAAVGWDADLIV